MDIDNFVIANKNIDNIVKNSVGVIKAINGNFAMVFLLEKTNSKEPKLKIWKLLIFIKRAKVIKIRYAIFVIY